MADDLTLPPAPPPEAPTLPPPAAETGTLPPQAAFTGSPTATLARESADPDARPQVPGYAIERELGRGGMGVVYKARDLKLGRTVALKMILSGAHAGADDLARFIAEAEAVAQLQHANVVQLFEAGRHGGLPFFTLEFVPGGSLADRLKGTPLPPTEAARLVEQLARGVQHAHERGIVHRDLKPHNVLLAEDGTPKVTDFGLARRVEVGSGLTATGAVMGTPSYMAPEQASGDGKRVGPATDVYALGAILYECLTGRPPFQGPTPLDTVLQVVSDEPVPVRQLQSKVPADLEIICLKCLLKEPARRYGSAADLADDLRRFTEGRPITARPVSGLERGWRWCQRNPAVAALSGAVMLALLGGTIVSSLFAVEANDRAEAEAAARLVALRNEDEANRARRNLEQSNDRLRATAAHGLLRPLTLHPTGAAAHPLTPTEMDALWDLAETNEEPLRLRFFEEAVRLPGALPRLRSRADYAVQAALALAASRREQVERILLERMKSNPASINDGGELALCLATLQGLRPKAAMAAASALTSALAETTDVETIKRVIRGLAAVLGSLQPTEAPAVCAQASASLIALAARLKGADSLPELADCLAEAASRAGSGGAKVIAEKLIGVMTGTINPYLMRDLVRGLEALAPQLGAEDAALVATRLTTAVVSARNANAAASLADGLAVVANRVSPTDAREVALALTDAVMRTFDHAIAQGMTRGLAAAAARLDAPAARAVASKLAAAVSESADPFAAGQLSRSLAGVAQRLGPEEAAATCERVAAILNSAMHRTTDPSALLELWRGLAELAPRLKTAEAGNACAPAATALVAAMSRTKDPSWLRKLAQAVTEAAGHIEPAQAVEPLSAAMKAAMKAPAAMLQLSRGLANAAARMEPAEGATVCSKAAAALVAAMKTTSPAALRELSLGLAKVANHMEPGEAAAVCGWAVTGIIGLLPRLPAGASDGLSDGVAKLAAFMNERDLDTVTAALSSSVTKATVASGYPGAVRELVRSLAAVTARLPLQKANGVCGGAARTLTVALEQNSIAVRELSRGLAAIAPRLDARQAGEAAEVLRAAKAWSDDAALESLSEGLAALALRMAPEESVAALNAAMTRAGSCPAAILHLSRGVAAAAARMEADAADATCYRAAAALLVSYARSSDAAFRADCSQALSELLACEPDELRLRRAQAVAACVGILGGLPALVPLSQAVARPNPLPAQTLVDVLKHPLCVGKARSVVLDALGARYRQRFADPWDFVRFATDNNLGLDLTSPAKRPAAPR